MHSRALFGGGKTEKPRDLRRENLFQFFISTFFYALAATACE